MSSQPDLFPPIQRSITGRLPCPFCGSTELSLIVFGEKQTPLMIQCKKCGASGPNSVEEPTEAILRALWDLRAVVV